MKEKTRISTTGNLNRSFTLIELTVVVFLIGVVLFLAVPRIHDGFFKDGMRSAVKYIISTSRELRNDAVRENKDFVLNVDMNNSIIWFETSDMTPEKKDEMKNKCFRLPDRVKIMDVEVLGLGKKTDGVAAIRFFRKGYTQPAIIHLTQDEKVFTLVYNPFSGSVRTYDKYVEANEKSGEVKI